MQGHNSTKPIQPNMKDEDSLIYENNFTSTSYDAPFRSTIGPERISLMNNFFS